MDKTATETVFDFALPPSDPSEAEEQRKKADALLDELAAGAAVHAVAPDGTAAEEASTGAPADPEPAATESPIPSPAPETTTSTEEAIARLSIEIDSLLTPDPDAPPVLPDNALPVIRTGLPHPPVETPPTPPPVSFPASPADNESEGASKPQPPSPVDATKRPWPPHKKTKAPPPWPQVIDPPAPNRLTLSEAQLLDEEIGRLAEEVQRILSARREITGHALSLLSEARNILLTEPERIVRAEYNIRQVRTILERAKESRRQSARYAFKVVLYLAFWLSGVAAGVAALALYQREAERIFNALLGAQSPMLGHAQPFLWALLAGAGGGILSALADLVAHIRSRQDFDRQVALRFYIQPVMGGILGGAIYLLLSFVFFLMGQDLSSSFITRPLPAFAALCAGLWQQWVYAALYRILGFFSLRSRRR